jgi:predicted GNAT superfamily acetyltransferase
MPPPQVPSAVAGDVVAAAEAAALAAADRAGVTVRDSETVEECREVAALFESVWGRGPDGAPMSSELLRSLVHAGGSTTAAYDGAGVVQGGAALMLAAPAGSTYSLIAAARPGASDRGIGLAVKLHQRAWSLRRGLSLMRWTFDPLVARNARFNLVKLGATVDEYAVSFYGPMGDEINRSDDSDRAVARWEIASPRAVAAADAASVGPTADPGPAPGGRGRAGPDGAPMLHEDDAGLWVRVPRDIVAVRRTDPAAAAQWRIEVREVFVDALARGLAATHLNRDGWYLLTPRSDP